MHENDKNINKKRNKINCNTCLALVSLFYSSKMSMVVREAIIYHLIKCDKCLERYVSYENNHPEYEDIKVKDVIIKLRKELLSDNEQFTSDFTDAVEVTSSYDLDSNTDNSHFNPTKWQDAAATFDIETLMNLKFF